MPRRDRPLIRESDTLRDASLIVIASEDTHAVEDYFGRFRPRRVQFRIIGTEDGRSSPEAIAKRLDDYRAEFQIGLGDELWYCGDTDHWIKGNHRENLDSVLAHCRRANYRVALSSPCFELWLLMHFEEAPLTALNARDAEARLRILAGGYSKRNGCVAEITTDDVNRAVARAKARDQGDGTGSGIPENPSTHVHRIVISMTARQVIELR